MINSLTCIRKFYLVRFKGARNTDIIPESEEIFVICDEATGLAEKYSQKKPHPYHCLRNISQQILLC